MSPRRFGEEDLDSQEFPAVRKDTPTAVSTNNHFHPLLIDANGRLYVNIGGESVALAAGTYLGQQVIAGNNGNQNATIPDGTKAIQVMAEGGPVGCTVNGTSASVAAAGYHVPENAVRLIGPFSNLTSLGVFAATGDNAHLIYEA
jgi:hypothetical protein